QSRHSDAWQAGRRPQRRHFELGTSGAAIMSRLNLRAGLSGLILIACLAHGPARAQAFATYLSHSGFDSNNCATRTTSCQTMDAALAATAARSTIVVLDNYAYVTGNDHITKSISIVTETGPKVFSDNQLSINASASDDITLRGLVFDMRGLSAPSLI